jgi:hypothetical protein
VAQTASDGTTGYVPVTFKDGNWKTAEGDAVPWYEVQTDLLAPDEVEGALNRVLSVYGVSDVVVDAFDQLRKELQRSGSAADPSE